MPRFYPLTVTRIDRETRDAVAVTLSPRPEDTAAFDFTQGQYLTFRHDYEGEELRRSYSICAGRGEGLRIGIKRVEGGAFSSWANKELAVGDILDAMPPMGTFFTPIEPDSARHYLGFAVGSGITPVLGLIRTILAEEPKARFTLVYGNRSIHTVMFREELEDLKNLNMGRLNVIHILGGRDRDIDLFAGRIDGDKCTALFERWIDIASIDQAFICGPEPMMETVAASLKEHGLTDEQIKYELFASAPLRRNDGVPAAGTTIADNVACRAIIRIEGEPHAVNMLEGESILAAARRAELDPPFACTAGVCSTCMAKLTAGEAEMEVNHALEDYEVRRGYVLTCQAVPVSEEIEVEYEG